MHELAEHEKRLCHPDGYRPPNCLRCGAKPLHLHDHLERILPGNSRVPRIDIVRYICAERTCRATWRVLPAFVARHLWRHWETVERTIAGAPQRSGNAPVSERTRRRWDARLRSAARQVVSILAQHDADDIGLFITVAQLDWTRRQVLHRLWVGRVIGPHGPADVAAALHVLEPGVRLM